MSTWAGTPLIVSPALPIPPSDGEWARRFVRHGMADVLAWLGEEVGPKPTDQTHCIAGFDGSRTGGAVLMVSRELHDRLTTIPTDTSPSDGAREDHP